MKRFGDYVAKALGVRLPEEYARFLERYGEKLASDPVIEKSWVSGLGNADFVVGTTQAFRATIPRFSAENVVIGYSGIKTIVINRVYEEIDTYLILNVRDGKILSMDSLGVSEAIGADFEAWVSPELLRARLKEKYQSTLTVILFENEARAVEARRKLKDLQKQGHIDLDDVVVVVKEADGSTRYHQPRKPTKKGAVIGSVTGLIVGTILFSPLIGAVLGTAAAAAAASLTEIDTGIDTQFIKDLAQQFQPGGSALFTLVRKADAERVAEAFLGFGGRVMTNSLSKAREAAIQAILDETGEKE